MTSTISDSSINDVLKGLSETVLTDKEAYEIIQELAAPIVGDLQQNAPEKTGAVMRSIRVFRGSKDPYKRVQIGPQNVKGGGPDAGNAAHLTEWGTDERVMLKGLRAGNITQNTMEPYKGPSFYRPYRGKSTGRVQPMNWIQQVFERVKDRTKAKGADLMVQAVIDKAKEKGFKVT